MAPEAPDHKHLDRHLSSEQQESVDAKKLGGDICENAKKISPESNKDGKLDSAHKDYIASIDTIEKEFGDKNPEEKNKALRAAASEYTDKIGSAIGTTEWGEAKLIKDGQKAITRWEEADKKGTSDWKDALKKFSSDLQERLTKKHIADGQKEAEKRQNVLTKNDVPTWVENKAAGQAAETGKGWPA